MFDLSFDEMGRKIGPHERAFLLARVSFQGVERDRAD
jgi:hypothetical protein